MKTLDTRDLYKRKCELEELKEAIETAQEELKEHMEAEPTLADDDYEEAYATWEEEKEEFESAVDQAEYLFGTDEQEELSELEEIEGYASDFKGGETMIPTHSFKEYAQLFADDIGAINRDATWPLNCINWDEAAEELAMDYSQVTYQGQDYYVRS